MNPVFRNISNHAALGIWYVSDSIEVLYSQLEENAPDEIKKYHPNKKVEFLASRILMRKLCGFLEVPYEGMWKDDCGKPYLLNNDHHISISHSFPYVICMLDKKHPCGIDIEAPKDKLLRIKHKFLSQTEQDHVAQNVDLLCQYWCAKEALYKLYGRKRLSFSKNINIKSVDKNILIGSIHTDGQSDEYKLVSELIGGYYLVYSI
ncbi:4'-phosphopantetheinyl transferase superfamily protein [Reichenbachiella sp. MALMAid0571]|uniref:4'-phosphopantetheinyl transferase family protein n=1 Tax=Reichenbachiella sp. MALMAid0571 TaxID=3143939 RepID=UPI0032DF2643